MATEPEDDEFGSVDFLLVELRPGQRTFDGELAMELAALVDAGVIRLLDLLVIEKDEAGAVTSFEIDALPHAPEVLALRGEVAEVLAEQDVADLAAAISPGRAAGVLVWENSWAAPLAAAAHRSGGQVVASGRIPITALVGSLGSLGGPDADA